ncbi:ABC transporter ATP-binding protein [Marinilabiliaceae bacterium ANBcel2]|nr:ABC transporter ATP-binding protein [Marinilabiliaceae bacterium ANBcel2]
MIHTRDLIKRYKTDNYSTDALININIDINKEEFVAVAGPAGSGKTTLFNILGLMVKPDSGEVWFLDKKTSNLWDKELTNLRKGKISYIFRHFNLIDELTVYQNIELPLIYLKYKKKERKEALSQILKKLKIEHKKEMFPNQLTGLQQQITCIARAVVTKPSLILADDPAGNLNSEGGREILELLTDVNEDGHTVVLFTSSAAEAEKARRVIQLFDGHVVTDAKKDNFII